MARVDVKIPTFHNDPQNHQKVSVTYFALSLKHDNLVLPTDVAKDFLLSLPLQSFLRGAVMAYDTVIDIPYHVHYYIN